MRNDDMIISAGYNIAGPEVMAVLLAHDEMKISSRNSLR
jgi:acyl-coenzyme A synthetase/AMP-(fatty) acid ligase